MTIQLPLIRGLSRPLSRWLIVLPVTANQVTAAALLAGLGSAWCLMRGGWGMTVAGALLLVLCYLFDNADGDVARAKGQCSEFGRRFDSFVDWLVHTAFFAGLGAGTASALGSDLWLWLGLAAAAGGTINYAVGIVLDLRDRAAGGQPAAQGTPETAPRPANGWEWLVYAFRELSRADFCFLVLILALMDGLWLLLPAGAVGAQVYWLLQFVRGAREYHV